MPGKVQLIKTEIERLKHSTSNAYDRGRFMLLSEIEDFIDSLPEEPVSEDLEEACDNYYDETWDEHGGIAMVINNCHDIWFPSQAMEDFFKAGANWQKEQMMKDAVYAAAHKGLDDIVMDVQYM